MLAQIPAYLPPTREMWSELHTASFALAYCRHLESKPADGISLVLSLKFSLHFKDDNNSRFPE